MPHDLVVLPPTSVIDPATLFATDIDRAKALVSEELALSTRQGYGRDLRLFRVWCASRGITLQCDTEGRLLTPVSSDMVAAYIGAMVAAGSIRSGTMNRRIAAIGYACKIAGQPDPTQGPAVRSALKGARRHLGIAPIHRKSAVTPDMLISMLDHCPPTLAGKRDRALLTIGWSLALRRSELVALNVEDIKQVPGGIHVSVNRSKTDQEAAGVTIAAPDRPRDRIRPARELRAWLKASRIKSGAIFVRVNRAGHTEARLDSGRISQIVKGRARQAGLDAESLGGHSLRVGFVTSAAAAGASAATMANVTRHTSMDVLFTYIRTQNLVADYPATILR